MCSNRVTREKKSKEAEKQDTEHTQDWRGRPGGRPGGEVRGGGGIENQPRDARRESADLRVHSRALRGCDSNRARRAQHEGRAEFPSPTAAPTSQSRRSDEAGTLIRRQPGVPRGVPAFRRGGKPTLPYRLIRINTQPTYKLLVNDNFPYGCRHKYPGPQTGAHVTLDPHVWGHSGSL